MLFGTVKLIIQTGTVSVLWMIMSLGSYMFGISIRHHIYVSLSTPYEILCIYSMYTSDLHYVYTLYIIYLYSKCTTYVHYDKILLYIHYKTTINNFYELTKLSTTTYHMISWFNLVWFLLCVRVQLYTYVVRKYLRTFVRCSPTVR